MKMIVAALFLPGFLSLHSCGTDSDNTSIGNYTQTSSRPVIPAVDTEKIFDPAIGVGRFLVVELPSKVDRGKAARGKQIFEVKCAQCHRLTTDVITGPGLKGITQIHSAVWILNFLTNTDEMLQRDPSLAAKAEIYQSRMPNLELTDEEAFVLLEYLRLNDVK